MSTALETQKRGIDGGRRTIENDDISDSCLDFLRLKDQAGVLIGAVTTDDNGYSLGQGQ